MLTLTVISPTVNIRSGPSDAASIIGKATVGQQYEVINIIDSGKSREQWARIVHDKHEQAYLCIRTASGSGLCQVANAPQNTNAEFIKGWNACLDALEQVAHTLRK